MNGMTVEEKERKREKLVESTKSQMSQSAANGRKRSLAVANSRKSRKRSQMVTNGRKCRKCHKCRNCRKSHKCLKKVRPNFITVTCHSCSSYSY